MHTLKPIAATSQAVPEVTRVATTSASPSGAPLVWLALGPPGSGKGTHAGLASKTYGVAHISTGELLRREIALGTPLGRRIAGAIERGEMTDDGPVNELVKKRILEADCQRGFILDGYPRTVQQAVFLDALLRSRGIAPPTVIFIDVSHDVVRQRLLARGRKDDNPEAIEGRLRTYESVSKVVLSHYPKRLVHRVDGSRS